jgi:hypothetical protein
MHVKFDIHLTRKNCLSVVIGACVVGLAIIPIAVPAEHIGWMRWQVLAYVLMGVAIVALIAQTIMQSREDDQREERERERDKREGERDHRERERDERLTLFLGRFEAVSRESVEERPKPMEATVESPADTDSEGLYVELYEPTFFYPQVGDFAFKLLQGKYVASGKKAEEAKTECDFLIELFAVNKSKTKIYIKDFSAWLEIDGTWQKLTPDDNFHLTDLWSGSVEYGLERADGDERKGPDPLSSLLDKKYKEIQPAEPIEGWLKFSTPEINPELRYPLRVAIIDTMDREHHIDKSVAKKREIALRRVTPRTWSETL